MTVSLSYSVFFVCFSNSTLLIFSLGALICSHYSDFIFFNAYYLNLHSNQIILILISWICCMDKLSMAIRSPSSKSCPCPTCQENTLDSTKFFFFFCITFSQQFKNLLFCLFLQRMHFFIHLLISSHFTYCNFLRLENNKPYSNLSDSHC